ncbi:YIP1 family protein [Haladaptatus sp. CMSO5]|uniref:YIP1 family protein n=1 Tax=Haladaptatus sp. CMSO5 TaxID=3120514 RepID=UPI002FCE250D
MTQWVENPTGGRDRGPVALAQAWVEVLVRPRRFFRAAVAPGDQAPGLVFAGLVVTIEEATRFLLVENAYPIFGGQESLSFIFALALAALFVAPAALHLTAAIQTLLLIPFAPERGGVSETVQLLAYAAAPCVFAGIPIPAVRAACALYGAVLLVVGVHKIHQVSIPRALVLGAIPAAIIFGFGFRGFPAFATLLGIV